MMGYLALSLWRIRDHLLTGRQQAEGDDPSVVSVEVALPPPAPSLPTWRNLPVGNVLEASLASLPS